MVDAPEKIWPERLTLRDSKVYADEGQRIFTTATGYGYEKREYLRSDIAERQIAELRAERDTLSMHLEARTILAEKPKRFSSAPATADGWRDMSEAPNNDTIIVRWDDDRIEIVQADDNDFDWQPYPGKDDYCSRPIGWLPMSFLPAAPTTTGGR